MRRGENFEIEATNHLANKFSSYGVSFKRHLTSDSTSSDIEVLKDGRTLFLIEAKDKSAQAGQFVLLPDNMTRMFKFSDLNSSSLTDNTLAIIRYMNLHYDMFSNAGTKGVELMMDKKIFEEWIKNHYLGLGAKYIISRKRDMFILPISKFAEYFDVKAVYRVKKSGSREPSKKVTNKVIEKLESELNDAQLYTEQVGKKQKLYVKTTQVSDGLKFNIEENTFQLSKVKGFSSIYEVRQLSNTNNPNVIFSIKAKKEQEKIDLEKFINEICMS